MTARVDYLDRIRVLLTFLVILHHVAAGYGGPGAWYYHEPVSGPGSAMAFMFLMAVNQAFFMGFFFLLAGYFVPTSMRRKGRRAFLRDRLVRLGIPLVVYFLVINPAVTRLAGGGWEPGPGPMWFVEVLLLFTLAWVALEPIVPAIGPPRVDLRSTSVLAIAMTAGSFLVRIRWPVNEWLPFPTIQPAHATQYACAFVAGVWLSGSDLAGRIPPGVPRFWRRAALAASVAVAVAFVSVDVPGDGKVILDPLVGGGTWQSFVTALWEQVVGVAMVTNLLAAFGARAGASGPVLSAAAASAYTVYVVHPLVVVGLAMALRDVAVPSLVKFLAIAPVAVAVLFASADRIRRAPLLREVL